MINEQHQSELASATDDQLCELAQVLLDFGELGFFSLNQKWEITRWNRIMEQLYDIPAREVLGKHFLYFFDVFAAEEKEFSLVIQDVIRTGQARELLGFRHQSKKKGKRTIDFKILPITASPTEIHGVYVLVHDITDRLLQRQRLNEYEQFTANILHDAIDAIIVLDEQDRITMWNRGAETLFGWKSEDVINKPTTVIVPDDPEFLQQIEWLNHQVREKGFVRNFRTKRKTRLGKIVELSITRTAIYNHQHEFVGSPVIAHNITEEKRLEEQLIQSEKLSAVGKLAAGIAHEVGTPLTSISSLAQYLREIATNDFFKEKLQIIQNEIERISRTVRELVDFSRPIEDQIAEIQINQVIEEAVRIVRFDRRLKRRSILLQLSPTLPKIRAAFDQILQVFVNMLLNAADALENRVNGKIEITTAQIEDQIQIVVADNGEGIDRQNLKLIFEPFFTTKKKGKGTGLGLWVSYNIVKSHAGEIEVTSEPGSSTRFTIWLPLNVSTSRENQTGMEK